MRLTWPDATLPEAIHQSLVGPGRPFELVTEEVRGVPLEVFANRPRHLPDLLASAAARYGERPYVVFPERSLTFTSIMAAAAATARTLADRFGVRRGDRVAVASANCIEYALTFWATTLLGGVTVALNGWWTGPEMAHALTLTEPRVLLGDARRMARLEGQSLPDGLATVIFERDFGAMEAAGAGAPWEGPAIAEDDPFLILFTSGTTGRPKGALLSHRGNIHAVQMAMLRGMETMARARAVARDDAPAPIGPQCVISASPYFTYPD
jgi:acyl-CoA synthetase (AMP-forming)/AMP-acid ligase II